MNFNIGSQTGGVINNVSGNQRVSGGQHGQAVSTDATRHALRELRAAVLQAGLDDGRAAAVAAPLEDIDAELAKPEPDRSKVGRALDELTALLLSAGALASAGQALAGPIRAIASWVGSWGPSVAQLMGG
ncbi:hypothetical protein JTF08_16525 [Micrococcaceae bacterium RIT802]|nr:hypothetical protein [Micrococcaceae bacterium RIT 802]